MKANDIQKLVKNTSPYETIMIDGYWGVGKSYEIKKALIDNTNSCILSLFGINSCKEMFSSLFLRLGLNNKIAEETCKKAVDLARLLFKRFDINSVFYDAPKELTFQLLKRVKKNCIIVFDDLERVGCDFNFEEFLGIVEELKEIDDIKVILIANTSKFNDVNKDIYFKYHEKVIDKIYKIEEISSNIDWKHLEIEDPLFTEEYIENFNIKNLRTIQKAEQFFKDVKMEIDEGKIIIEDNFLDILKKICYSIVVEDIKGLGEQKLKEQHIEFSEDSMFFPEGSDKFSGIVWRYYLNELDDEMFISMIKMLCNYYKNNDFIIEFIKDGITLYKKMGEKINFFKSDDELKKMIEEVKLEFFNSSDFIEALKQADTILVWMNVLEIDSINFFSQLKEKLETLIDDAIDKDSKINEFYALWTLNSKELKEYVEEIFKSLDKRTFEKHISSIKVFVSNGDYRKAYMKIKDISDREWHGVEESKIGELLNSDILPLGSISGEHWRMYKALKDLFMKTDYGEQLWVDYIKIAVEKNKYDKAFLNRMDSY